MKKKYIISLDQGTSSSRAILFNENAKIIDIKQCEIEQIFPKPGWVEHNPEEIIATQTKVLDDLIDNNSIHPSEIDSIAITNQRETTVLWNKTTGKPICNAIVWQDKRTSNLCSKLKEEGHQDHFKQSSGLVIDSYFSGTKINWILNNVEGAKTLAEENKLLFGTIDTWLIWKLTKGEIHATDYSNASRTLLFDINSLAWDDKSLKILDIPKSILPCIKNSSDDYGLYEYKGTKIPIRGAIGDQQAALFGQCCFEPGEAKNTYGTGCFMLLNTGNKRIESKNGLLTTIAWGIDDNILYALEGSIFIAGAAIQWLRDGLKIISESNETEQLAQEANEDEVIVVPAFAGLGAPYWDMYARGAIFGLTRDSGISEISRATLESLAFQTKDVLIAMEEDSGIHLQSLNVDGGASANNYLMQFQSDILNTPVNRPDIIESTALGAAFMAGLHTGFWKKEDLKTMKSINQVFKPSKDTTLFIKKYLLWTEAVKRSMNWTK
ncbi:MAG: glycerol kinase GlpK [Flavobacteriales bacterium]|nr:glycerol kinase GlpK [Flavobacteriales bacterium]